MLSSWIKAAAFVAGGALAMGGLYGISEAADPVYRDAAARTELFRARAPRLEAVSVGNSHALAVDFAGLGMEGMHFWSGAQDVFESAYLARYAVRRAPGLRFVLMTAVYGLETQDHAAMYDADVAEYRSWMYARTPVFGYIPGDRDVWLSARLAPIVRPDHWQGVVHRLYRPRRPIHLTADGANAIMPPTLRDAALADHGARVARGQNSAVVRALRRSPGTSARALRTLLELASELRQRGVILVLYTPPYHWSYMDQIAPERRVGTRRTLAPLLRAPNVFWLDFASDPAFVRSDTLFIDSNHVNPAGARAFSARLRGCLRPLRPGAGAQLPAACQRVAPPLPSRAAAASSAPGERASASTARREGAK